MNGGFYDPSDEGFFLEDPLDSSNHFPGMPNAASSDPTQAEDTSPQFDRVSQWWEGSLSLEDLEPSGLQPNGMQPGGFQHIPQPSNDGIFPKGYTAGHNIQAPHGLNFATIATTNNARSRAVNPWPYSYRPMFGNTIPQQDLDRPMMYRDSSLYENPDFIAETQHSLDFGSSFRDGSDVTIPSVPFTNQFTSSDLGVMSEIPNADDIASLVESQASCDSRCASSVCENENCSETGTPCDDPTCVENVSTTGIPVLADHTPTYAASGAILSHQPHSQPCNHTESEHLVARTLGELRAPGELDLRGKTPCLPDFNYNALLHPCEQFYDGNYQPYSANPRQIHTKVEDPGSNDPQISLLPTRSLTNTPSAANGSEKHPGGICVFMGWVPSEARPALRYAWQTPPPHLNTLGLPTPVKSATWDFPDSRLSSSTRGFIQASNLSNVLWKVALWPSSKKAL
ncbi:hypothetical protein O1611_g8645 [Lasiodiplodia mahajangana]|uniref:Uncharacterized protein n=1 Tax=Lasiodiplodia mahajangana TaxID=1108764 RepID=A0ACC2JC23_9PEZI|nr:hypothetical protein O1611_g8645 [Lasiodiplodia mahajangana]